MGFHPGLCLIFQGLRDCPLKPRDGGKTMDWLSAWETCGFRVHLTEHLNWVCDPQTTCHPRKVYCLAPFDLDKCGPLKCQWPRLLGHNFAGALRTQVQRAGVLGMWAAFPLLPLLTRVTPQSGFEDLVEANH